MEEPREPASGVDGIVDPADEHVLDQQLAVGDGEMFPSGSEYIGKRVAELLRHEQRPRPVVGCVEREGEIDLGFGASESQNAVRYAYGGDGDGSVG